jgi:small-conductance mechanosensitive channel
MSKTIKELEGKLAELQAASVEAGVEFKRIDEQIEQAKLDFGMQVLEGKKADKSKLNELAEKRDELGMRLNALAKKIQDTQAELAEAKAVERTAAIEAYKAESAKQLEQIVKSIYELNTLAAKWLGLAREADRIMPNVLGYVGVSNEGLPVREIVDTTERWIQERGSYPQFTALLERAGVPSYRERMKRAKENG